MSLRQSLASALVCLTALCVGPVAGQTNNNPPQLSPVQQAVKALADAQVVLKKAQADVQHARDKVKAQLETKPEWASVAADLNKAQAEVKSTKIAAINALHTKPDYVDLVKQKDDADKIRQAAQAPVAAGDDKVSDADLNQANDTYIKAMIQMKAMEKKALGDDQAYNDALARLDGFNAKMAQLDAEVDDALKNDTDYQALQMAVTTAQQGVDQAKDQLTQARLAMAQQRQQQAQSRTPSTPRPR